MVSLGPFKVLVAQAYTHISFLSHTKNIHIYTYTHRFRLSLVSSVLGPLSRTGLQRPLHAYTHTHTRTHVCVCVRVYICIYMYIHYGPDRSKNDCERPTHTHTHTNTHAKIQINIYRCIRMLTMAGVASDRALREWGAKAYTRARAHTHTHTQHTKHTHVLTLTPKGSHITFFRS